MFKFNVSSNTIHYIISKSIILHICICCLCVFSHTCIFVDFSCFYMCTRGCTCVAFYSCTTSCTRKCLSMAACVCARVCNEQITCINLWLQTTALRVPWWKPGGRFTAGVRFEFFHETHVVSIGVRIQMLCAAVMYMKLESLLRFNSLSLRTYCSTRIPDKTRLTAYRQFQISF
jgi:hypothetical protein